MEYLGVRGSKRSKKEINRLPEDETKNEQW